MYFVRASGHSCSSRHLFSPMTKIRTGAQSGSAPSCSQCRNQSRRICVGSKVASGPKSMSPTTGTIGVQWAHGPTTSRWACRARSVGAWRCMPVKFWSIPARWTSYHPPTWMAGRSRSP